ncbi:MAG: hypothetical protein JWO58_2220 [Chitinophagaceae bacterium]|nr:hypothetical protein [Chitinophagaceae bacterium]
MKRNLLFFCITFFALALIFFALQKETVYNHSFKYIAKNWTENANGSGSMLIEKPYEQLNNINFVRWDALHYQLIKESGYSIEKAGGDYIFAFFPLFSWVWEISSLPPLGILLLNYFFFTIGVLLLLHSFNKSEDKNLLLLSFCFPGLACFLIPYTESLFFLVTAIAIWGYIKEKHWIYFIGMFLAALTRPAATLLIPAFLCVEFYYFLRYRNILHSIKSFFSKTLPLYIGTLFVSLYQLSYNSGSLFQFVKAQKSWGKELSIPNHIADWSEEAYGINLAILFCVFIPLAVYFIMAFVPSTDNPKKSSDEPKKYLQLLSIAFVIGTVCNILLFQHGDLHGLFRYVECSPFFYILIFSFFDTIKDLLFKLRLFSFLNSFFLALLFLMIIPYSTNWNFSDAGFFIFFLALALWLFQDLQENKLYKLTLYATFTLNLLWTTYLFNTYITNAWIFT